MAKIVCKIRKKEVEATPEERVRQEIIDLFVNDYSYPIDDIRVEYGVKKSP